DFEMHGLNNEWTRPIRSVDQELNNVHANADRCIPILFFCRSAPCHLYRYTTVYLPVAFCSTIVVSNVLLDRMSIHNQNIVHIFDILWHEEFPTQTSKFVVAIPFYHPQIVCSCISQCFPRHET